MRRPEPVFAVVGFAMLVAGVWGGVSMWAALGVGGVVLMLAAVKRVKA